jgi:hypothetical protein
MGMKRDIQSPETIPSTLEKDADGSVIGDPSMTAGQARYLEALCFEANEKFDPSLSKEHAQAHIDALQAKIGVILPVDLRKLGV